MSKQDLQPTSEAYGKRWQAEEAEAFEAEVQNQKRYVFLDEIKGDFGKRFKVRNVDRIAALKRICALATHTNASEQNGRARTIGCHDLFQALCNLVKDGHDVMQYWSALVLLQLLHKNIACCTIFLDMQGIGIMAEMLARAEDCMSKIEQGENPFDEYATLYSKPCTQHTLYVCLMILSNISHFFAESHEHIRETQRQWSFRVKGKDKNELPPPGILTVCTAVIRRGRTLEYPLFDAAIRLVYSLSQEQMNIMPLMRSDLTRSMAKHYEAETSEGPACKATAAHIQNFAAVLVQKYLRGHAGRNLVSKIKTSEMAMFYANFKKKTYIRGWKRFADNSKRVKNFFKGMFDKRGKFGTKICFQRWRQYVEWFKCIEQEAHTYFTWVSSRNRLFCDWIDFLRNEVAELNVKVQAKCKGVLVLMTGELFKNCLKEWKAIVQKTKVIKRRWLHGSKDTAMCKWKKLIADIHSKFDEAGDKLRVLCRHLTGDFASSTFHNWKDLLRKKKIAIKRFVHRTLFWGWDNWMEHMEDTNDLIRQVHIKCAHVMSLISGDLFHFCYLELSRFARRKIITRKMGTKAKRKLTNDVWQKWLNEVNTTVGIAAKICTRCASIVYYISHGGAVKCFAEWKDRMQKRRRAVRMFTHACLVHCWQVWVYEILPRARTVKRAKARMTNYLEHYFLRVWAYNVIELNRQRNTIDRIAFRMQNRGLVMCLSQWMHWTSETIYTREVVTKIRRTYEVRVVREPLEKWHTDASHSAHLKRLVYRIKNRVVMMGFEEMMRMVEEAKLKMKEAILEKSKLINRWLKRPMYRCWDAWSAYCAEVRRRDQMLKRLRYRMINAGAVLAVSEWQHMIRLQKEERRQLLYFAVADTVKKGASLELRATLSSHAIWNLRYDRSLMHEAMSQVLTRDLAAISRVPKSMLPGRAWNDSAGAGPKQLMKRPATNSNSRVSPSHLNSALVQHVAKCAPGINKNAHATQDMVTGTSIHALLLLVDHVEPGMCLAPFCKFSRNFCVGAILASGPGIFIHTYKRFM